MPPPSVRPPAFPSICPRCRRGARSPAPACPTASSRDGPAWGPARPRRPRGRVRAVRRQAPRAPGRQFPLPPPLSPGPYRQVNTAESKQGKFYSPGRAGGSATQPGGGRWQEPGAVVPSPPPVPTALVTGIPAVPPGAGPVAARAAPTKPRGVLQRGWVTPHGSCGGHVGSSRWGRGTQAWRGWQSEKKAQTCLCPAVSGSDRGVGSPFGGLRQVDDANP